LETMFPKILLPLKKELEQVEQRIQQEMKIRAGHISQLINLQLHWWDKYLHPAVLILSGRMFGYSHPKMFTMACVVQLIHIATGIHYKKYDQRPGLPVLIGDYLYAKFFSYLCNGEALEWLPELAQVINDVHDAGVRETENRELLSSDVDSYINLLKKQSSLLGTCSTFGIKATGNHTIYEPALRTFGLNLGAALKLLKDKKYLAQARQLLLEAGQELNKLPDKAEKNILCGLLDACREELHQVSLAG